MKISIFGGVGFIGSHFIEDCLESIEGLELVIVDKLTYAANMSFLAKLKQTKNVTFVHADLNEPEIYQNMIRNSRYAVNFAAESHVDNSIRNPMPFFKANALGVSNVIMACMNSEVSKFIQVSTDEVYGSIEHGDFDEESKLDPSSPYSSSKASGDLIALSIWKTFKYPILITRGCNTFGPRQFPEKLIPLAIDRVNRNLPIPIYGSGHQIREWIYVKDHASAIKKVAEEGIPGQIYNIGSGERLTNLGMINSLLRLMGKDPSKFIEFIEDRKGHDQRYAINSLKIRSSLNWRNQFTIETGLLHMFGSKTTYST